jgi:hypothetical protein
MVQAVANKTDGAFAKFSIRVAPVRPDHRRIPVEGGRRSKRDAVLASVEFVFAGIEGDRHFSSYPQH